MTIERLLARRGRVLLAVLGVTLAALAAPQPARAVLPPDGGTITVTARDVTASNEKVAMAYAALAAMWRTEFRQAGARFVVPDIVRYRGAARSRCGVMDAGNAFYCPDDNAIYYDEVFVAAQAKRAARTLGTDGDMAAIGVVAHEMGHAVAMQLGVVSPYPYENEAIADCLAGAFARQAAHDGSLERGDVEEAFYAMSTAGDPTPRLTGNRRVDRVLLTRAALLGHGTREQRMHNFDAGLEGGPAACLR
ncbi:MAG TPA: neutral zinc metallopeptidase [Gemmatimonadaceae bacterium]|nr:neutral zinc metallopeptidase [Gemmatimonadaceae bacterium]